MGTTLAALLGLAFGSFLNVCLTRWPEGESVVKPRSHCRACNRTLAWWENLPLVSWVALGGRCRTCKSRIGWRYPLVELAVGALWGFMMWRSTPPLVDAITTRSGLTVQLGTFIEFLVFFWLMVALAVLDAEHLWLPNWLTFPGIAIGFLATFLIVQANANDVLSFYGALPLKSRFLAHLVFKQILAILAAGGLIVLIRWTYWLFRKQEGIGLGDAKLMAMLAAWLGLPGALLSFVLGVLMSAVFALILLALPRARRGADSWAMTRVPLGTFLCIGGVISALWGHQIILAYLRMEGLA